MSDKQTTKTPVYWRDLFILSGAQLAVGLIALVALLWWLT